jgi:hypothetical protein
MKNLWQTLDGRKTYIGACLAVIYAGLVSQGIIPRNEALEYVIYVTLGVGFGHKAYKGE